MPENASQAVVPPSKGRIPQVDGLRGLAIFMVLVWHCVPVLVPPSDSRALAYAMMPFRLLWSGVDLFFVLSGFLIGGILVDARETPNYFKVFYARRFFRIIPLYALVCVAYAVAVAAGGASWGGEAGRWLFAHPLRWYVFPLFLQNVAVAVRGSFDPAALGVTWSLAVEEQFYLTLPFLVRFLPRRRLLPVVLGVTALVPFLRSLVFYVVPHGGVTAYVLMPTRADSLLVGVIAALLVRDPRAWSILLRSRGPMQWAAWGIVAASAVCIRLGATNNQSAVVSTVGYTALAALAGLVLLLALTDDSGLLGRVLRTRWLQSLGEIAYGTYLLHVLVIGTCFGIMTRRQPALASFGDFGVIAFAMVATIALARTSWELFEKRVVRFGHRFVYEAPRPEGAAHLVTPIRSFPLR